MYILWLCFIVTAFILWVGDRKGICSVGTRSPAILRSALLRQWAL